MTKKSKIITFSSIGIIVVLVLAVFLVFWIPPKKDNYRLSIAEIGWTEKNEEGNYVANYLNPKEMEECEVPLGISVNFYSHLLNSSKRKQVISFTGERVIRIKIFHNTELIAETENTETEKHTLEFMTILPGFSGSAVEADCFAYTFSQTGNYTVIAESSFAQKWKNYTYQTEPLTVIVK